MIGNAKPPGTRAALFLNRKDLWSSPRFVTMCEEARTNCFADRSARRGRGASKTRFKPSRKLVLAYNTARMLWGNLLSPALSSGFRSEEREMSTSEIAELSILLIQQKTGPPFSTRAQERWSMEREQLRSVALAWGVGRAWRCVVGRLAFFRRDPGDRFGGCRLRRAF